MPVKDFDSVLQDICELLTSSNALISTDELYYESRKLWSVLTALRGPDWTGPIMPVADSELKECTTEVIRYELLRRRKGSGAYFSLAYVSKDRPAFVERRREIDTSTHFGLHAKAAFLALGLKWDELNHQEWKEQDASTKPKEDAER